MPQHFQTYNFGEFAQYAREEAMKFGQSLPKIKEEYAKLYPKLADALQQDMTANPKLHEGLEAEVKSIQRARLGVAPAHSSQLRENLEGFHGEDHRTHPSFKKFGSLRAFGPIAAIADAVGYTANKQEAEAKLQATLGRDGVPQLSATAIAAYGDIVATTRVAQGITSGLGDAIGFSQFLDWGKENKIPVEALVKLNPTSKSREEIERGMEVRGSVLAQSDNPDVTLASTPVVPQHSGRDGGIA